MPAAAKKSSETETPGQQVLALLQQRKLGEAETLLRQVLQKQPDWAEGHNNLGVVLAEQGRQADALPAFDEAVRLQPDYAHALHNRGNTLRRPGRLTEALVSYENALRLEPEAGDFANNMGIALLGLGRRPEAVERFRQAMRHRPDLTEAANNLGVALAEMGQLAEAAAIYQQVLKRRPRSAETHNNLGVALAGQGRFREALECYRQAVSLKADYGEAHNNLGNALRQEGQLAEAATSLRQAIALNARYAEAHNNLAIVLVKQGDLKAAIPAYQEAITLKPDYAEAQTNLAFAWIMDGDFEHGWPQYEWRFRMKDFVKRSFTQPRWDGCALNGQRILLYAEQGLGDTIQFIRYAPLLQRSGLKVLVEAPRVLLPLLRGCAGIDELLPQGSPLPDFDVQAPLLSMPALCRTTLATVPATVPYLSPEAERAGHWKTELSRIAGFKIGIAWQGSPKYREDRLRSVPLKHFAVLAQLPGVRLISLQKGFGTEQLRDAPAAWNILDLGSRLDEEGGAFLDTAAVMQQLDLVISSDTALVHLAGPRRAHLDGTPPGVRLALDDGAGRLSVVSDDAAVSPAELGRLGRGVPASCGRVAPATAGTGSFSAPQQDVRSSLASTGLRPGRSLAAAGQVHRSRGHIRETLRLQPDSARTHHNLAVVLAARGKPQEACIHYQHALRLRTDFVTAVSRAADALEKQGKHDEAVALYEQSLEKPHETAEEYVRLGKEQVRGKQRLQAGAYFRLALQRQPDAEAHYQLGLVLYGRGQFTESAESFLQSVGLRPEDAEVRHGLGNALRRLDRMAEAEACYREALRRQPDATHILNHLGIAVLAQGRPADAEQCFRDSARCDANHAQARNNLGVALEQQGKIDEAVRAYQESLRLQPDNAETHRNLALGQLLMGRFEEGWPEYEWRWRCPNAVKRSFTEPRWDGTPLNGRQILLWAEQGLGDTIQFIRYASLVQQRGGAVVVEAPAKLLPLLRRCAGIDVLLPQGATLPDFDVQAPLLSLPALLRTTLSTAPADVPYLSAEPERLDFWAAELRSVPGFKIGIAWQGSATYSGDRQRSIALKHFAPLAQLPGVRLISLQKGFGTEQLRDAPAAWNILDLGSRLDEEGGAFLDTAAVLQQLDLVISSDTSLVHLAGALAVPTWVALPVARWSWRWLMERTDSPWYPTMRLFRQRNWGDWDEVFARIAEEVRRLSATGLRGPLLTEIAPGELLDKITILEIKRSRISDRDKLNNVSVELGSLLLAQTRVLAEPPGLESLMRELKDVNERLWDVEDELRQCERKQTFDSHFIELARSVYFHNDRRARVKRRINEVCGSALIEEKSYPLYGPTPA